MCGEKALSTFSSRKNSGSPPRMRGKVQPDADGCRPPGITPAYAGKRRAAKRYKRLLWDHPRVCGEKPCFASLFPAGAGSPPRMRGKGTDKTGSAAFSGITPAYAGKSLKLLLSAFHLQDHPRVCGEKNSSTTTAAGRAGSPPRMRGKDGVYVLGCSGHGITPAYAGKRRQGWRGRSGSGDHPRVCGEKGEAMATPVPVSGSPPRMRGKGMTKEQAILWVGITPAYAGKSCLQC